MDMASKLIYIYIDIYKPMPVHLRASAPKQTAAALPVAKETPLECSHDGVWYLLERSCEHYDAISGTSSRSCPGKDHGN